MSHVFRLRQGAVVSEIIDGEAVIMHLRTGRYYSARGTAATVWAMVEAGSDIDTIIDRHAAASGAELATVRADIEAFLATAGEQQLGDRQALTTGSHAPDDGAALPTVWQKPILEMFSDLEDLLLLDPIHEVAEEAGWPRQRPVA